MEVRKLNWKAALLLLAVLFASAVTTVAVSLDLPQPRQLRIAERIVLGKGFQPLGDPIINPDGPN